MNRPHSASVPPPAPLGWITLAVVGWCLAGALGWLWQTRGADPGGAAQAPSSTPSSLAPSAADTPPPSLADLVPGAEPEVEPPVSAAEHRRQIDALRTRIVELEAENAKMEADLERAREETRAYRNGAQRAVDLLNKEMRERERNGGRSGQQRPSGDSRSKRGADMVVHEPYATLDEAGCFCARVRGEVSNVGSARGSGEVLIELLANDQVVDSTTAYVDIGPDERQDYAVEFDLFGDGPFAVRARWDG